MAASVAAIAAPFLTLLMPGLTPIVIPAARVVGQNRSGKRQPSCQQQDRTLHDEPLTDEPVIDAVPPVVNVH
jgi:hypothetical protein